MPVCLVFLGALVCASPALGHAFPDHSAPRVGSVVAPPHEVKIWFDGPLEPVFSTIKVLDSGGKRVDKSDARVDPSDKHLLRVSLPLLPAGRYTVYWTAISWDGHRTEGHFEFEVKG